MMLSEIPSKSRFWDKHHGLPKGKSRFRKKKVKAYSISCVKHQ